MIIALALQLCFTVSIIHTQRGGLGAVRKNFTAPQVDLEMLPGDSKDVNFQVGPIMFQNYSSFDSQVCNFTTVGLVKEEAKVTSIDHFDFKTPLQLSSKTILLKYVPAGGGSPSRIDIMEMKDNKGEPKIIPRLSGLITGSITAANVKFWPLWEPSSTGPLKYILFEDEIAYHILELSEQNLELQIKKTGTLSGVVKTTSELQFITTPLAAFGTTYTRFVITPGSTFSVTSNTVNAGFSMTLSPEYISKDVLFMKRDDTNVNFYNPADGTELFSSNHVIPFSSLYQIVKGAVIVSGRTEATGGNDIFQIHEPYFEGTTLKVKHSSQSFDKKDPEQKTSIVPNTENFIDALSHQGIYYMITDQSFLQIIPDRRNDTLLTPNTTNIEYQQFFSHFVKYSDTAVTLPRLLLTNIKPDAYKDALLVLSKTSGNKYNLHPIKGGEVKGTCKLSLIEEEPKKTVFFYFGQGQDKEYGQLRSRIVVITNPEGEVEDFGKAIIFFSAGWYVFSVVVTIIIFIIACVKLNASAKVYDSMANKHLSNHKPQTVVMNSETQPINTGKVIA